MKNKESEEGFKNAALRAQTADKSLRAALDEAKAITDPWEAFKLLDQRETAILTANNPCFSGQCQAVPAWEDSKQMRIRLLGAAAAQANPKALDLLYEQGMPNDDYIAIRRANFDTYLSYLDAPTSTPTRAQLVIAGRIFATGREAVMDSGRAVGYFARAWAAGEASAANEAAMVFMKINDFRNAYLWSLRCIGTCQRDNSIELRSLESHLDPDAAKQAQRLASSLTVVEMDVAAEKGK